MFAFSTLHRASKTFPFSPVQKSSSAYRTYATIVMATDPKKYSLNRKESTYPPTKDSVEDLIYIVLQTRCYVSRILKDPVQLLLYLNLFPGI